MFLLFLAAARPAAAAPPVFSYKCRVVSVETPKGMPVIVPPEKIEWSWGIRPAPISNGTGWSAEGLFTAAAGAKAAAAYPNANNKGFVALATKLALLPSGMSVGTNGSLWNVEVQVVFSGPDSGSLSLKGKLFGGSLGMMLSKNRTKMRTPVQTMADFNEERYGSAFEKVKVHNRPKLFPVVDRFIAGDDDYNNWEAGIQRLSDLGLNGVSTEPYHTVTRGILEKAGQHLTSGGIYSPPGAEPDTGATHNSTALAAWATKTAKSFLAVGYAPQQMTTFALADEPGWYMPKAAPENYVAPGSTHYQPGVQASWQAFLQQNGLTPATFSKKEWSQVLPWTRRWEAKTLPQKVLFYWSARFSSFSSAQSFARATVALENAFFKGLPVYVNFNNFAGRGFVPGPVGNNRNRTDPDAAMLSLDWFEFARARGSTLIWTEDWFGDSMAVQWAYYMSRFQSAVQLSPHSGEIQTGGYIVGRESGEGIFKKVLAIVGNGGKAIKYYVFGPEYNFPGNCYSERLLSDPSMLQAQARAHDFISRAEPLLWPAKRIAAAVAILYPRSSFFWDEQGTALPKSIMDCTNTHMTSGTTDYLAEVYGLWYSLVVRQNIPVDFIDEEGAADTAVLKRYKVIFVTEPDLPTKSATALVSWMEAGGTLVTVSNAAVYDEYDEASAIVSAATGLASKRDGTSPPGRFYPGAIRAVKNGSSTNGGGAFTAFGATGHFVGLHNSSAVKVLATFDDHSPATVSAVVKKGLAVHFAWLPGLSSQKQNIPAIDTQLAGLCAVAVAAHPAVVQVSKTDVQTPLLRGPAGDVVTLLNWNNHKNFTALELNVSRLGYTPAKIVSMEHGTVQFDEQAPGQLLTMTLPLGSADMVLIYR